MTDTKVFARHPDPSRQGTSIDQVKYEQMRKALLQVIPRRTAGIAFAQLSKLVTPHLDKAVFKGASIQWYVTTVKLDLEARGLIERVPKARPQKVRKR